MYFLKILQTNQFSRSYIQRVLHSFVDQINFIPSRMKNTYMYRGSNYSASMLVIIAYFSFRKVSAHSEAFPTILLVCVCVQAPSFSNSA